MKNISPASSSSEGPKGKRSERSRERVEITETIPRRNRNRTRTRTRTPNPRRVEEWPPYGSSSSSSSPSPVSRQGPPLPPPPAAGLFGWLGRGGGLLPMGMQAIPVGWGGDGSSCRSGGGGGGGVGGFAGLVIGSSTRKKGGRAVGKGSSAARGKGKQPQIQANKPGVRYACTVCPKTFETTKGLFGHMRTHQDRGWKGTYPPPAFSRDEFADLGLLNLEEDGEAANGGENPPPVPGGGEATIQYLLPDLNLSPPPTDDEK